MGSRRGGLRTLKLKESQIERAIGDYLFYSGFCFYKQNTRGFYDSKVKRFRKDLNPYALSGLPDYVVIYRGFHLGLEVKTETGKQSPNQKEFETYLKLKGGARASVVRSVDETKSTVEDFKSFVDSVFGSPSLLSQ